MTRWLPLGVSGAGSPLVVRAAEFAPLTAGSPVGIKALKDLHRAMHPAASVLRTRSAQAEGQDTLVVEGLLETLEAEVREEG